MLEASSNKEWWQRQADSTAEYYAATFKIGDELSRFSSLQGCAWFYVWSAFKLLVTETSPELSTIILERAIEVATKAIEIESYEKMYYRMKHYQDENGMVIIEEDRDFHPSKKEVQIQRLNGTLTCLKSIYYAHILLNKSIDQKLIAKITTYYNESYALYYAKSFSIEAFEEILYWCLESNNADMAISYYKEYNKSIPIDKLILKKDYNRNPIYVLYIIANYLSGKHELGLYVEKGMDYWIRRCNNWYIPGSIAILPDWIRINWAILYFYIKNETYDVNSIIKLLRGY